jgi:hypothetical protein
MNLILSILFFVLNLSLILLFNKIISPKKGIIIGIILIIVLIILNSIFKAIPIRILFLTILFSISLIILKLMSSLIEIFDTSKAFDSIQKINVKRIKSVIINNVFPIVIFIYQLLLIWNKGLQQQIINN